MNRLFCITSEHMSFKAQHLPYRNTHSFSQLVYHYLDTDVSLQPYFSYQPDMEGIGKAIETRKFSSANRNALVAELNRQYQKMNPYQAVAKNLELLANENCFTVCTAHQPNIFTGHLYFVYKILHAIKLAAQLKSSFPEKDFVPVFFMGSEDADLNELGEVFFGGEKMNWQTTQQGAVGRMQVDKSLLKMLDDISGQLGVLPHGKNVMDLLRRNYVAGSTIEQSTFSLVNELFGKFGLVILLPDSAPIKRMFVPVMEMELKEKFSAGAVKETLAGYPKSFRIDSFGRDINLFYLDENGRNRIEQKGDSYFIEHTSRQFSREEIIQDLHTHPERYSPNVILRPVLQEAILPNVAFIGGGGELAYWLRLKLVFEKAAIDFPVLILRNSFLLISKKWGALMKKLDLGVPQLFLDEVTLSAEWVREHSGLQLMLQNEKEELSQIYRKMEQVAGKVDPTLAVHTNALLVKGLKKIDLLEKKLVRAAKKKHEAAIREIGFLKGELFPGGLQERIENIMFWLAIHGMEFLDVLLQESSSVEPRFTVLKEV